MLSAQGKSLNFAEAWNAAKTWENPRFPLKGRDLLKLGLEPQREFGKILEKVEKWWIGRDFAPSHSECLQEARRLLGFDDCEQ